jgi:hypothetical protein
MKKVLVVVLAVIAVTAVVLGLYGYKHGWFTKKPEPPPTAVKPTPPPASYLVREQEKLPPVDQTLTKRLIDTTQTGNVAEPVSILLDPAKDPTSRNEAANLLHRSGYQGLVDDLIKVLNNPAEGPLFRSYCIQHLWMCGKDASIEEGQKAKVMGVLRSSLADRHAKVRREALLALVRLKDPLGRETAIKWLTAPEGADARDASIRCVEELNLRDQAPAIRQLAHDPDENTAVMAIATLGRWEDQASRTIFEEAVKSRSPRLQAAGKAALRHLDKGGKS